MNCRIVETVKSCSLAGGAFDRQIWHYMVGYLNTVLARGAGI